MFMRCKCGHIFSAVDRQSGQFVDCPECRSSWLDERTDATEPLASDVPQMSPDGPSVDQMSINTEFPPLPFQHSNKRIAIDTENRMITFDNCFVPGTGFWNLRIRSVKSHTCSLSDVIRVNRYNWHHRQTSTHDESVGRTTEIITNAGKARFRVACSIRSKEYNAREVGDEQLWKNCRYLHSEGYASLERTPPSDGILVVVFCVLAFVGLGLAWVFFP
jgi:hypothetical protein